MTVGLYRNPGSGGAVGEVLSSQERRQKEVEIGNTQAWSYPNGTLVLWECYLEKFARDRAFQEDLNMLALWRSVEAFLVQQFPQAERIVTTSHDPMFDTDEYRTFLDSLGQGN